jgi:hypothetical protein
MLSSFLLHSSSYRNYYWLLRSERSLSARRTIYRRIAKEKGHLVALGWSEEVIRLYGLWLKNPSLQRREKRFHEAFNKSLQLPLFQ